VLLASADGGKTWREPFERIKDATLDAIRFTDFEYGWISGQILHPVPHDPFVVLTSSGGKIWTKRPLFDDARPGTILQMWFESRNNGSLVVDRGQSTEGMRYELYESATGGESWMIREASDKPPRIRRAPLAPLNTDWRIRADAASKSFRIEKRESGKWNVIASFLFQLDPCTPPQAKEPEPPPETAEQPAPPQPDMDFNAATGKWVPRAAPSKKKK
jgi:hypothetical protein